MVQRRPSNPLPQRVSQAPCLVVKETRIMRRRQALQELCHLRGQAVVDLVPRRPQRIAAGLRERVDLQHGVVGGDALEADVGMPAHRGEPAGIAELVGEAATFFLLLAADDADLVTKLAAFFG